MLTPRFELIMLAVKEGVRAEKEKGGRGRQEKDGVRGRGGGRRRCGGRAGGKDWAAAAFGGVPGQGNCTVEAVSRLRGSSGVLVPQGIRFC